MILQPEKSKGIAYFILGFFISYILIFLLVYSIFSDLQKSILLPILKTEVTFLDPTSQIHSLTSLPGEIFGNIHFEIALVRHPEGDPSIATGILTQKANFALRDNVLLLCLMLALSISWPGLSFFRRIQACCIVLFSWGCLFSLLFPFALLNDGIPPVGFRLTMISWWNAFLTHKGIIILTLLFFAGNMYAIYLLGQKSLTNKIDSTTTTNNPSPP